MPTIVILVLATLAFTSSVAIFALFKRPKYASLSLSVLGTAAAMVAFPALLSLRPSDGWEAFTDVIAIVQVTLVVGAIHLLLLLALLIAWASERHPGGPDPLSR